jgi:uncharacterized protein (TIGR02284 family)
LIKLCYSVPTGVVSSDSWNTHLDCTRAAKRWFDSLKQKMSGDDASIIAAVEAAEDHIKEVYQDVMTDEELSDPIRMAVETEFAQIEANHDEMRNLKHATS